MEGYGMLCRVIVSPVRCGNKAQLYSRHVKTGCTFGILSQYFIRPSVVLLSNPPETTELFFNERSHGESKH